MKKNKFPAWTIDQEIRELQPWEVIELDPETREVYSERIAVLRAEKKAAEKAAKKAAAKAKRERAKDPAVIAHNAAMSALAAAYRAELEADPEYQARVAANEADEAAFFARNRRLAELSPQAAMRQRLAYYAQ